MPYNSTQLKTITTGYAEYKINASETLPVLLGSAYFSGVTAGTVIKIVDGTYDVVSLYPDGVLVTVSSLGTATILGTTLTPSAEIITTTRTITPSENGKVFYLNNSAGFDVTLPLPFLGARYEFFVQTQPTGANYRVSTNGAVNSMRGHALTSNVTSITDADSNEGNQRRVEFVASTAVVGDYATLYSNGSNWFARCECAVFNGITLTT